MEFSSQTTRIQDTLLKRYGHCLDDWDYELGYEQIITAFKEEKADKMFQLYLIDRGAVLQATGNVLPFDKYDLDYIPPTDDIKPMSDIDRTIEIFQKAEKMKRGDA